MKRPNLIIKAVLGCLALSSTILAQEPAPPAVQPSGPMVQLSLIVTDSKNKSLSQVSKNDVHVIEDKVEQQVLSIAPDERPVDNGEKKGFRNVEVKLISPSGEKRKAIVPRGYGSQ